MSTTSSLQTSLLTQLLREFHDDLLMDDNSLVHLLHYLFEQQPLALPIERQELAETIYFLKDLAESEGFVSIEEMLAFFLQEKNQTRLLMQSIEEELNVNAIPDTFNADFLFINAADNLNREFYWSIKQILKQLSAYLPTDAYSLQGSYTKANTKYLTCFTQKRHDQKLFILQGSIHKEIELRDINYLFWKVNIPLYSSCASAFNCTFFAGHSYVMDYDQLLNDMTKEKPIADPSFKTKLAHWIFSANCAELTPTAPCGNIIHGFMDHRPLPTQNENVEEKYVRQLMDKKWVILKSPKRSSWLTSDNPGFIIDMDHSNAVPIEANPILNDLEANSLLYFPLSKDYCLKIHPDNNNEHPGTVEDAILFEDSSEKELQLVNQFTVTTKRNVVIASDKKMLEPFQGI